MASLMPNGKQQYFNPTTGRPLAGGKLWTYAAGTSTKKPTYQDADGVTENTNPITLDSTGSALVYWDGSYKVVLKDSAGNTVWTVDNYNTDPLGISRFFTSIGSSLIGFIQSGAGAVARWVQDKLRENVSVTDFMTADQRADALTGTPTMDHTAAFAAAIAAADVVNIPPGTYSISNLKINKSNFTLQGAGVNRSIIQTTAEANVAIEVASDANVSFLLLKDFKIQGNSTGLGGIKLGSDSYYCAGAQLIRTHVWDFSRTGPTAGFGVQLNQVQELTAHNCWIYRNRHGYQRPNGGYCTSTHITGKSGYAGEGYIGIYIDGQCDDLYIDGPILEGNNNSALVVTANAVGDARGSTIYVNGTYQEANNTSGAGVISVTGGTGPYQDHTLVLERLNFAQNTGKYLYLDRVIATVRNCKLIPGQVQTTVNTCAHFDGCRYPNGADYLAQYRALPGNITVRDTNVPFNDTSLTQINLVNALTFPETERIVTDPRTLDIVRKQMTWTPILDSDGTPPTYELLEPAEGTYSRVADLMFCRCKLRVKITDIGTGTPRVTGFPYPSLGLEPPVIGLSTALTNPGTPDYLLAGPALVFNGASYALTNDGYLVFSITYQAALT